MERFAVFSDVHADQLALRSILDAAKTSGIENLWCLGDFCSGGPEPVECFDLVMNNCQVILGGNHEWFVINGVWLQTHAPYAQAACMAADELGNYKLSRLRALSSHVGSERLGVQMVHGSLTDPVHDFMTEPSEARATAALMSEQVLLFGHTHKAAAWLLHDGKPPELMQPAPGAQLDIEPGVRYMLNPGLGCDTSGARWLDLSLDGEGNGRAVWKQTQTPGHGGRFSATPE